MTRALIPSSTHSLALGAAILLSARAGHAQDATIAATAPAPPPAPAEVVTRAPVVAAPVDAPERDFAHFRFGLGLDASYLVSPGSDGLGGLGIGVQVRLGAQVNQWFAAYYQAHGVLGGTLDDSGSLTSAGTGAIGAVFNSAMIEATLPVLHVGVGPSLDFIAVQGLVSGSSTANFGLDGRAAIVIGGHGPGRHGGFAVNFNVHPSFWESTVLTTLSLGIGGEMY